MKKQVNKLTLKTDQIVSLSKIDAQQIRGGMMPDKSTKIGCPSIYCTPSGKGCFPA
ncbi:class I lanthipeptide [Spirosoma gilvum]